MVRKDNVLIIGED